MDDAARWADVASALVGVPSGLCLFRHSPLGWGHAARSSAPSEAILASCPGASPIIESRFHHLLRRRYPTLWFSCYTPCATQYELKYCRRTLTRSTVAAVERSLRNCPSQQDAMKASHKQEISRAAFRIASDQKVWVLRFVSFVVTKILGWLYGNDVYVDEETVKQIKILQKTHTLIYAPTHKSHLDSVIMGYLMFAYGLEPPHIVAGDNLQLPLLSFLMRGSGAFFIRRSNKGRSDREAYKKILAGFIEALMWHGKHIEFFVEGGRSRDGCILKPRLGILANVVDAFIDADLPKSGNVAVIPVDISYDHPIEEKALVRELMGEPKERETLWGFVSDCCTVLESSAEATGNRRKVWLRNDFFWEASAFEDAPSVFVEGCDGAEPEKESDGQSTEDISVFPPSSAERYDAVSKLGDAIHRQLCRIRIIPASSVLYCTVFIESYLHLEHRRQVSMGEVIRSLGQLQSLLKGTGAQLMMFDTQKVKTTVQRIHGFAERLDSWITYNPEPSPSENVGFSVRPCMASSVMYYIRSNHLLGKLAPTCLVSCALVACLHGFGQSSSEESWLGRARVAPRQSDFARTLCADRSSILGAAIWLRELLAPELDPFLGETGYRTLADLQECLDRLLDEGVLVACIPPTTVFAKDAASVSSSAASGTQGTQGSQRRSVDRVVDKLIFGVMEEMDRPPPRTSLQFESDLQKCRDLPGLSHRKQRARPVPGKIPYVQAVPTTISVSTKEENEGSSHPFIGFAGDLKGGCDFYSFLYGPLIATYAHLFHDLDRIFSKKTDYDERHLIRCLMSGLRAAWESSREQNLLRTPVPCLTIVQRFVAALTQPRHPSRDLPFTPYPTLTVGMPSTPGTAGSARPPRPSTGETRLRLSSDRDSLGLNSKSTSSLLDLAQQTGPSSPGANALFHLRREFRDGALDKCGSKLRLFLVDSEDTFF